MINIKKIIWIFGESATGKKTLIETIINNSNLDLLKELDLKNKKMLLEPNITTRGFVIVNDNQELIKKIQNKTNIIALNELEKDNFNLTDLKNRIILEINSYVIELTGRRPIIIPMILDVNKSN